MTLLLRTHRSRIRIRKLFPIFCKKFEVKRNFIIEVIEDLKSGEMDRIWSFFCYRFRQPMFLFPSNFLQKIGNNFLIRIPERWALGSKVTDRLDIPTPGATLEVLKELENNF